MRPSFRLALPALAVAAVLLTKATAQMPSATTAIWKDNYQTKSVSGVISLDLGGGHRGERGFRAAARMYARDVPKMSPGRYLGQSLFAWVLLFELPVILLAGLFRLLQSVGLFR